MRKRLMTGFLLELVALGTSRSLAEPTTAFTYQGLLTDGGSPAEAALAQLTVSAEERAVIERKVRQNLKLPADAPLGPAEFARVTELNLTGILTDVGAAWLADPATGFTGLTTLVLKNSRLTDMPVTDAGLATLARPDTGLRALTTLDLTDLPVTDAGLAALARADTGLKGLTTLDLTFTQVTDAGLKDLARPDTGLKGLTTLSLIRDNRNTKVTDAGLKDLARADTGLKGLTTLMLNGTQ